MTNPHGSFIWYELITSDPTAAARFYADVVGWKVAPFEGPPGSEAIDYQILSAADGGVGGLLRLPDPAMKPGWYGYIGVDDVDATLVAAERAGGRLCMPATDLPGVGRIAMLADPGGVPVYVMRASSDGTSGAFSPTAEGHCGWNELVAADLPAARDFHLGLFGWSQTEVMSMGAMGEYQFLDHAGQRIGAMMQNPPGWGAPHWTFYFRVPSIAAAAETAKAGGGTITHGPMEVPGGDWVVQGLDPQGVAFALVGGKG